MLTRTATCLALMTALLWAVGQADIREHALPGEGVFPEGVAYDEGSGRLFVSSAGTGALYAGQPDSDEFEVFLAGDDDESLGEAYGMTVDERDRLWVAGGPTGLVAVYDLEDANRVGFLQGVEEDDTFLNDLVYAPDGYVYVADSRHPVLLRVQADEDEVGRLEPWLDLTDSPIEWQDGDAPEGINLNGIEATEDGEWLITVDMNDGKLYRIGLGDGAVEEIDIGGESLLNGDGLVLDGSTLYVIRLTENEVAVVELSDDLASGEVTARFTHDDLHWPATGALANDRLYLANTQFDRQETGDPELPFVVVSVPVTAVQEAGQDDAEGGDAAAGETEDGDAAAGEAESEPEAQADTEDGSETKGEGGGETEGEADTDGEAEPEEEQADEHAEGEAAEDEDAADLHPLLRDYNPVTDERLRDPEPANWLMWLRAYDSWSYSPLDQIDRENVRNLRPVWSFSTGLREGHEAPPIVNDGVMFVATPENNVLALDAATGDLLWRYERDLPHDLFQLHPTNRGVALYDDKVYLATLDAYLVALDARSGEVLWETVVEDLREAYYMTLAPLVIDGRVLVGVSGGELGIRGFIQAFDAETGESAWKTYTIPGAGEPGNETWPGDTWRQGGGSVWITGAYDPEMGLTYWGIGNAAPWTGDARPGDNLYTTSVIALDSETGEIRNHFQYHWNDSWDWDEVATPLLIDLERDGEKVPGLMHVGRNGYIWWLERGPDEMSFIDAQEYVFQNAFDSIDPENGRPEYDEDHKPGIDHEVDFCPSLWGGKDWPPAAFNPETGYIYIPANDNHCSTMSGIEEQYVAGQTYFGASSEFYVADEEENIGELQAWDVNSGEQVWVHEFEDSPMWGPVMTTAGGLVFTGGTNDRYFRAFDAESGELLWQFRTNSGINAVPVSFEVDGTQYIAVQAGWGVDAVRIQSAIAADLGGRWDVDVPQGGVVWVFAVDDEAGGRTAGGGAGEEPADTDADAEPGDEEQDDDR